jgi:predicted dehydrogenase
VAQHLRSPPPVHVALAGAGTIAGRYASGLQATPGFELVAVCSETGESARALAAEFGLRALSFGDMLHDPSIEYVLNLTPAHAHEHVTRASLQAGKNVYSEKPLAGCLGGADALIELAESRGLLLACAPATFLWPPLATARRIVTEGILGRIAGALTVLAYPGPEIFHPNPAHLYGAAAGPLHDMGVYQVTALMALLGPVSRVSAMASTAYPRRTVRVGPSAGATFPVDAPTHIHAQLQHPGGAISTVIVSFDASGTSGPIFEVFGERAGLSLAEFHSPQSAVSLRRFGEEPEIVPPDGPEWTEADWSVGPTSAWRQWKAGVPVETGAARAREVLEVLIALEAALSSAQVLQLPLGG